MTRRLVPLAMLTVAAHAMAAQGAQPEMVSRKLVEEISGADSLLIGRLPAKLQGKFFLPSTSRVIGSLGGATVIVSTLPKAQTLKDLEREMPKLGWKTLLHSRPDWGFVFSNDSATSDYGLVLCGHDTWLTINVVPSTEPGTRLRATAGGMSGDCAGVGFIESGRWRPPPEYDPIQVRLLNPTSARANAYDACPFAGFSNQAQGVLETSLTVDSLTAWYGKQLNDAGWTPIAPGGKISSWTRPDSSGKLARIDLRIQGRADAPRCFDTHYQIRPVRP